ncbi:MAG TPA: kelch repeat-containing protein, partial [Thermoplasmata archaeon]|nr:kelch repeat-containing protein [Thermoplasmata archaeon]
MILFGGWAGTKPYNDTWSYNPATNRWTNRTPATHPELYCGVCFATAAMVFDSHANRVILFGETQPTHGAALTWAYDPDANTWTRMNPATSPGLRHDVNLVYDTAADRVLLFGGGAIAPDVFYLGTNQTWSYDYTNDNWTQLVPAVSPPSRFGASMAYDPKADRTFLFGGCTNGYMEGCSVANDTWSYEYGTNTWTNLSAASSPPPPVDLPMVYDSVADHLILFGQGWGGGNKTWSYNITSNAWATQHPSASPPSRGYPGMTYDSVHGQTILFGGYGSNLFNDTWSYTYGPATPSKPSAPCSLRAHMDLTYAGENVFLSWQPPADDGGHPIIEYLVYRGPTSGSETFLTTTAGTSYVDSFATKGATYYYEVSALNVLGEGPRSNEVNSTPTAPSAPGNVRVTVGTTANTWNQVNLSWYPPAYDGGSTLTEYRVYRGTASGAESFLASAGLRQWYVDTGVLNGTPYYYEVTASNAIGEGARSNEVHATPTMPPPPPPPPDYEAPTVVITYPAWGAVLNATVVTVQGTASDNVAVVRVQVSVNNGSWILANGTTS